MAIDALIKTVLSELKVAINSKTVIGDPVREANWTIIPVTKVSFGFGAGGGEGKKESVGFGGGSGGGATIEPVAFIAVGQSEVKLFSLKDKETVWEKILTVENAEKIYKKIMGMGEDKPEEKKAGPDKPPAEKPPGSDPSKA